MRTHFGAISGLNGDKLYLYLTIFIFFISAFVPLAIAEEPHDEHAHEFHRHHSALIISNTQNEEGDNGFTVGVDYEYRFNQWAGIGGLVEYAGGDFEHLVLAVPLYIHPYKNWLLVVAGGAEVHKEHDEHEENKQKREWIVRTGIAYQFPFADKWTIAPVFNVDFSEHETLFVYGIAIGFGF